MWLNFDIRSLSKSLATFPAIFFATTFVVSLTPVHADPLEGAIQTHAPLEGAIEARPPLQGEVNQKSTSGTLQPGVGKFADQPLRGSTDQSALQGNVDTSSRKPLQGAVDDSRRTPLQGAVNDQGASLGTRVPNFSAVMRIIQIKKTDAKPLIVQPPISHDEIEQARFRDDVNVNKVPLRAEDTSEPRPLRAKVVGEPVHHDSPVSRPQRAALSVPQRTDQAPPSRTLISEDAPPARSVEGLTDRPSRGLMEVPPPTTRVELNPERNLMRDRDSVNVRPAPEQNARLLPPPPNSAISTAPQRAQPNGFQEPVKKKKRDKKTNLKLTPNALPPATPELSAVEAEALLWDPWYRHVNDLVCVALRTTMPKHGNPAGTNRVHITVWSDHRIEPKLVESNNPNFDAAIIEAYKSLNGSAELEFPRGTHRKQNDYESAHIQEVPATTAAFQSTTVRGDLERIVK